MGICFLFSCTFLAILDLFATHITYDAMGLIIHRLCTESESVSWLCVLVFNTLSTYKRPLGDAFARPSTTSYSPFAVVPFFPRLSFKTFFA